MLTGTINIAMNNNSYLTLESGNSQNYHKSNQKSWELHVLTAIDCESETKPFFVRAFKLNLWGKMYGVPYLIITSRGWAKCKNSVKLLRAVWLHKIAIVLLWKLSCLKLCQYMFFL